MIKRIPRLVHPKDYSAWALQELADINAKCLKVAATVQPSENFLFVIRAPVPWHQQFLIAREYASHNLFATHPVALEIRRLWDSKYLAIRLNN